MISRSVSSARRDAVRPLNHIVVLSLLSATLVACQPSTDNVPITTTTPAGQSTAAPAAAAERADNAQLRFVHAVPAGATVDLFADDTRTFEGVAFKTVTPYREVDGQRYTFRLRPAGLTGGNPLASNSEGLDDGDYYTVFAVPDDDGSVALRVVEDDFSRPATGKARVRVVHAAPDLGELDVYASGRDDEIFDGVDFQSVTDYDEIDPWSGTLDIRAENGTSTLTTIANASFEAGRVYTVVVVGKLQGTPKLEAFVIDDRIGTSPVMTR